MIKCTFGIGQHFTRKDPVIGVEHAQIGPSHTHIRNEYKPECDPGESQRTQVNGPFRSQVIEGIEHRSKLLEFQMYTSTEERHLKSKQTTCG